MTSASPADLGRTPMTVDRDAATIPDAADGRPLELTSVVVDDDGQWPDPPAHDFQFGEWLRAEILAGRELRPTTDPDVPILIATAHHAHRVLRGPALADAVARVPAGILRNYSRHPR